MLIKPKFNFLFSFFFLFIILYFGSFTLDAADKETMPIPFTQGFASHGDDINNTLSDSVTENNENQRFQQDDNRRVKNLITYQMIFTTLPLAFGLIFLILFLFFKKAKENLYFAIFLFFYSASIFFDYQSSLYAEVEQTLLYIRIHRAIQPFYLLFTLRFVYSLFYPRVLKRFWFFVPLLFVFGLYAVYSPSGDAGYQYFSWATIPLNIEIIRVIVNALWKKR
ncbi:MAG: hypothetical protein KAS65_04630, partial [Candidatus Aminicenantes bacterium]|nr:hypothetical protein [Candidatus Aminicenantes bacterium]